MKHTAAFGLGVVNGLTSDNLMGVGRADPSTLGPYSGSARFGQKVGDVLALVQTGLEMFGSVGTEAVGVALDATGIGSPAGVTLNAAGVGIFIHSLALGKTALGNLLKAEDANADAHGGVGEGAGDEVNIRKVSDDWLQQHGYSEHEIKEDFLGKKAQKSRFDIYRNKDNGELIIYLKGGKGEGIRTGIIIKD